MMIVLIGKDTDFVAVFNSNYQEYTIYYKGNVLREHLNFFRDVQPYLN